MVILTIIWVFLKGYWLDITLIAAFIVFLGYLWRKGKKETVQRIILDLVCRAEQQYGSKTGPIKLAAVWSGLYDRLPWVLRILFPRSELETYINDAVQWLKHKLSNNPKMNLLTYTEERKQPFTNR